MYHRVLSPGDFRHKTPLGAHSIGLISLRQAAYTLYHFVVIAEGRGKEETRSASKAKINETFPVTQTS